MYLQHSDDDPTETEEIQGAAKGIDGAEERLPARRQEHEQAHHRQRWTAYNSGHRRPDEEVSDEAQHRPRRHNHPDPASFSEVVLGVLEARNDAGVDAEAFEA